MVIIEMDNGTVASDSMAYLKEIVKAGRQRVFIILNKADLKEPSAREIIKRSITEECKRNGIRYDGILPYSSLMPNSPVMLSKPPAARNNTLKMVDEMRRGLFSVISGLSDQHLSILKARVEARNRILAAKIDDVVVKTRKRVMKANRVLKSDSPTSNNDLRSIVSDITDILEDQASACTSDNSSDMIKWHKIAGSGWIWNDWEVYLEYSSDAFKLLPKDRALLRSGIKARFESESWGSSTLVTKCIALLKEVGMCGERKKGFD